MPGFDDCPAWDGNPKNLPEYVKCNIEPLHLKSLVLSYDILDANTGAIKNVPPTAIHKHSENPESVIGVHINEQLYTYIVTNACSRPILFGKKDSPKELDREEWKAEFKTDALKLYFMKPYYHHHDEEDHEEHHPHHQNEGRPR
jgi:hypothetical protein